MIQDGKLRGVCHGPRYCGADGVRALGIGRYDLSRPQEVGLLACERPAEGLQAECRGHGRVQKNFAERVEEIRAQLAPCTPLEVWFQDEMRVGQKNKLTYRWARKGSRPRAAHDQRTQSAYLFGAVCPERGAGAALVLPACNTEAMQLHLEEIATNRALTLFSSWIKPGGMAPRPSRFQTTFCSCSSRRAHPNSTVKKISGNSCGRTGCRTEFSNPSTTSSITAATLGTRSSISRGKSCPSPAAIGQPQVTQFEDWYKLRKSPKCSRKIGDALMQDHGHIEAAAKVLSIRQVEHSRFSPSEFPIRGASLFG